MQLIKVKVVEESKGILEYFDDDKKIFETEAFLGRNGVTTNKKEGDFCHMRNYEKESDLRELPLAMAYVPWQHLDRIYENLEEALCVGTLFPELNKPFQGRRCVKK